MPSHNETVTFFYILRILNDKKMLDNGYFTGYNISDSPYIYKFLMKNKEVSYATA